MAKKTTTVVKMPKGMPPKGMPPKKSGRGC